MADPLTYANSDEYVLVNPNDPKVGHLIYDAPMVDAETKQFIRDPETGKIKVYRMVIWGTKGLTQTQVEALITEKNASMVTKVNTLETRITNFLDADDSTLDQLSELITEIKANKANIALIVSNKATKEELQEAVNTINTNIANSYVALANNQIITGNKTFTGEVNVPTVNSADNSTKAASTAFVQEALGTLTGTSVENLVTKNAEQTITGLKTFNNDVLFGSNGLRIRRNDTDKYIIIEAGADSSTASSVTISGTTRSNSEGVISLIARDGNNNYSSVYLRPDGTLAHNGNKVITQPDLANYVALSGNQTMTGVKTFTNAIIGSITGNAATATKATQDSDGNTIKTTYAKLNSPALTGTPTAPTASKGTNNTQIATTAFVKSQGYLTSHQSLDSCVKISGDQTIAGVKTFNSDIVFGSNGLHIRRNDTDKYLIFVAGGSSDTCSSVSINGPDRNSGNIILTARDVSNNFSYFRLQADGSIVWNGYSLKSLMSNYSMPGSAYSSLTVGASGSSYTAPDDGYVCMVAINQKGGEPSLLELKNTTNKLESRCLTSLGNYELSVLLPVCKGQSYSIKYYNVYNLALYYVRTVGALA